MAGWDQAPYIGPAPKTGNGQNVQRFIIVFEPKTLVVFVLVHFCPFAHFFTDFKK